MKTFIHYLFHYLYYNVDETVHMKMLDFKGGSITNIIRFISVIIDSWPEFRRCFTSICLTSICLTTNITGKFIEYNMWNFAKSKIYISNMICRLIFSVERFPEGQLCHILSLKLMKPIFFIMWIFFKRIFGTNFAYCKTKEEENEKRRKKSAQYWKRKTNKLSLNQRLSYRIQDHTYNKITK